MLNNFKYKRIIILGGSGSGKSTLANRIGVYTGYPIYHLDNILLNSDWSQKEKIEWLNICKKEFLLKEIGVVDGNYSSVLPDRIEWADLIIFINVPTRRHLFNIFKRSLMVNLGLEKRHGMEEGRKDTVDLKFFKWVLNWNRTHKKEMLNLMKLIDNKKVIITNKPRKLDIQKLLESDILM
jgi:adenylate kinase family enzyme